MLRIFFILFGCFVAAVSSAQKKKESYEQVWLGLVHQSRLSHAWGLGADVHLRTADGFVNGFSQAAARVNVNYFFGQKASVSAGYAYFHHFAGYAQRSRVQPEHRPWQQVQWETVSGPFRLQNRLRLEERFRRTTTANGLKDSAYSFNYRGRAALSLFYPLWKIERLNERASLLLQSETMLNFGKAIVRNTFDQQRLFLGVQLPLSPANGLQFGYLRIFQQQASGNVYRQIHAARIFYLQNLDFRKGKSRKEVGGKNATTFTEVPALYSAE